ncbi:MAG: hypothetical protein R3E32_03560 [Chitinophagales bacterium]
MTLLIWIFSLSVLFLGLNHLLRVLPAKIAAAFFIIVFILINIYTHYYPTKEELTFFIILKLYSVCLGVVYIQWMRFTGEKWYPLGQKIGYFILFVNILEATFFDFIDADYFNALLGVALLVSLKGPSAVSVNQNSRYRDVEYDLSMAWVFAYCLWNFVFNYNFRTGEGIPLAFFHLILPLILSLANPKLFIQHRAYFLAFSVLWFVSLPHEPPFIFQTPGIFIPWLAHILTAIGFGCVAIDVIARKNKNN